jgi:hypothetical protein
LEFFVNGIYIKVKDNLGNEVEGQPVGLQFLGDEERMTVKVPTHEELVAIAIPAGWKFSSENGWSHSWIG